jgi:hypothetical protein
MAPPQKVVALTFRESALCLCALSLAGEGFSSAEVMGEGLEGGLLPLAERILLLAAPFIGELCITWPLALEKGW